MLQDLRKYRFSLKEKPFALFFKTMIIIAKFICTDCKIQMCIFS